MTSDSALAESEVLLSLHGISKSFGGQKVLTDVSMEVTPGRVLGLVGENGAGKSTLLKIAAGLEQPDAGEVKIGGAPARLHRYRDAMECGVFMAFQEQALLGNLPVYENLFLGMSERFRRRGVLDRSAMRRRADEFFEELGLSQLIRAQRLLGTYEFDRRQLVEIVRAFAIADLLGVTHPVLLLDEATAALNHDERQLLFSLIQNVRGRAAIVFVSHLLGELIEICDELIVLKDGEVVGSRSAGGTTEAELHQLITGRARPEAFYLEERQRSQLGELALDGAGLSAEGEFADVDVRIRRGEVLGIAGVVGSGKEALGRVVARLDPPSAGAVRLHSAPTVGYVPKERKEDGIIGSQSILWNASLAGLTRGKFQRFGVLSLRDERAGVVRMVEELDVRPTDVNTLIGVLSGGNQQKVVLGRWTLASPDVLVLDNPTRGVDVGSRHSIYSLIRDLCDADIAIVLLSDDLLEVIGLSNRILAMRDRRVVAEVEAPYGHKPTEGDLIVHLT